MKGLICFSLLLLLTSCATISRYEAKVRSWEGKRMDALMNSWGPPDSIEKLSTGNRMLVYARLHHEPVAYGVPRRGIASVGAPNRNPAEQTVYIKCATYFEVNPQDVIVSTLFRGDQCKSE